MAYADVQLQRDDGRDAILPLGKVIAASRSLFRGLEALSEALLKKEGLTPLERTILLDVRKLRRATVPELARTRGFSRQHVQATVNPLVARGLLEFQPNPAHKRSKLVVLAEAGEVIIRRVMIREGEILKHLAPGLDAAGTAAAGEILAEIRRRVETFGD
jgi:DNA-binding MarR family transcriptional regulator